MRLRACPQSFAALLTICICLVTLLAKMKVLDPHEKDAESTVDAIIENEGVAALWHGFPAKVVSTCCYSVAAELIARKV